MRRDGPCPPESDFQHCRFEVSKAAVDWWDEDGDGQRESRSRVQRFESDQYQSDASRKLIRVEGDGNGDSRLDIIETYRYDGKGNLIRSEEDYGLIFDFEAA